MPLLDVTEILDDPSFSAEPGTVQVVRNVETIDQFGRVQLSPTTIDISSPPYSTIVTPSKGADLVFMPDVGRVTGAIDVYSTFRLNVETDTTAPDTVVWESKLWTVRTVQDFSPFGRGFVAATCQLKSIQGAQLGDLSS
jgi:hypothetical protein